MPKPLHLTRCADTPVDQPHQVVVDHLGHRLALKAHRIKNREGRILMHPRHATLGQFACEGDATARVDTKVRAPGARHARIVREPAQRCALTRAAEADDTDLKAREFPAHKALVPLCLCATVPQCLEECRGRLGQLLLELVELVRKLCGRGEPRLSTAGRRELAMVRERPQKRPRTGAGVQCESHLMREAIRQPISGGQRQSEVRESPDP